MRLSLICPCAWKTVFCSRLKQNPIEEVKPIQRATGKTATRTESSVPILASPDWNNLIRLLGSVLSAGIEFGYWDDVTDVLSPKFLELSLKQKLFRYARLCTKSSLEVLAARMPISRAMFAQPAPCRVTASTGSMTYKVGKERPTQSGTWGKSPECPVHTGPAPRP